MNYKINYRKDDYKKDYKNYIVYDLKKGLFKFSPFLALSVVLFLLSGLNLIEFDLNIIAVTISIFIGIMFFFELLNAYLRLKSLNKSVKTFKSGSENLVIESTQMKLYYGKIHYKPVFFSQIKKCLILDNVLFLVPKSEKDWPTRINKSEISETGFSYLIKLFENKGITITQK